MRKDEALVSTEVRNRERQFFKVRPNGGTDPRVYAVVAKLETIGDTTVEMKFSNVAGSTEGEHSVHKKCKASEMFWRFPDTVRVVREVEDLEMLPEVAPPAR
ncbi:hypothetical protein A2U01_0002117 [Trifolium medium]|uniref:Uncharacterized protein n=1 Tax=Trifolium medium TaxID=97028 RepID=A0A392M1X4_9FABA|nr:hypothetical protein [Trifolium medium]